jgi:hypothetical protein
MMARRPLRLLIASATLLALTACGGSTGEYAAEDPVGPKSGPRNKYDPRRDTESIFGEGGASVNSLNSLLRGENDDKGGGSLPVNRFLWQASLDTLSFLPLASTDPFTGVIATDWGVTPDSPEERFKVTAYVVDGRLEASSLKIAVFRERLADNGTWVPAQVDPQTPRRLEDAILTRARQIRLASEEGATTG